MCPFVSLSSSSSRPSQKFRSIGKLEQAFKSVVFNSNASSEEEFEIHLEEESGDFTTGDHVKGFIELQKHHWQQAGVEALLTCEEHAELDPEQCHCSVFDNRLLTFAGETIDGEPIDSSTMDAGIFRFDLRLLDDMQAPCIMPSFEVDHEHLVNAVRWYVVIKITTKRKFFISRREINVIPSSPLPVSNQLKLVRKEHELSLPNPSKLWQVGKLQGELSISGDTRVTGVMQVPDYKIPQSPARIPIKVGILFSEPLPVLLRNIRVEWLTDVVVKMGNDSSHFPLVETLASCKLSVVTPGKKVLDLSDHVPACSVDNACPGFQGKWLTVLHSLSCSVEFRFAATDEINTLTLTSPMDVLSPHTKNSLVDSPPVYSPPSQALSADFQTATTSCDFGSPFGMG